MFSEGEITFYCSVLFMIESALNQFLANHCSDSRRFSRDTDLVMVGFTSYGGSAFARTGLWLGIGSP